MRRVATVLMCTGVALSMFAISAGALAESSAPATGARAAQGTSADAADPAAKALIEECRNAIWKTKTLSGVVTSERTTQAPAGADAPAMSTIRDRGRFLVTIERAGPRGRLKWFRLAAMDSDGKPTVEHSFHDGKVMKLEHASKRLLSATIEDEQVLPVEAVGGLVPSWSMGDVLMQPLAKITMARLLPDAEIAGVKCKVVEYRVEVPQASEGGEARAMVVTQTRHIGVDDRLPRKIDSSVSYTGTWDEPMGGSQFVSEFAELKGSEAAQTSGFTIDLPAGYASAKGSGEELGMLDTSTPELRFKVGDAAPSFALKNPAGETVTLESLKGKVVLLDFWATWCGPCKAAMPGLQSLHEKYASEPVAILGVNTWERAGNKAAIDYMSKNKFTYGLLLKGDDLAKSYGISGIPTFVLIDKQGKITMLEVGMSEDGKAKLEAAIAKALKG
jgi:thiol-disulfide isomerase/thioredoxin